MSNNIAVILELTQEEADALFDLTLRGAHWAESGKFGNLVKNIFTALTAVGNGMGCISNVYSLPNWRKTL